MVISLKNLQFLNVTGEKEKLDPKLVAVTGKALAPGAAARSGVGTALPAGVPKLLSLGV